MIEEVKKILTRAALIDGFAKYITPETIESAAQQICQLFEPKPIAEFTSPIYVGEEAKPNEGGLLTETERIEIELEVEPPVGWSADRLIELVTIAQDARTASIKDAEWQARIIEFVDWLDNGTRSSASWRAEVRKFRQAFKKKEGVK